MKGNTLFSKPGAIRIFPIIGVSVLALLLAACDDGDPGPPGPPGEPGPPAGIDIGNAEQIEADISSVTIASPPVVVFTLTERNGNPVMNLPASAISFTIAKLVPGTDGNASAWQSYINQIEDPGVGPGTEAQPQATTENGSAGTLVEDPDGTYTYTFATDVANVTDPFPVAYDPNLTHRVSFEIRGFAPVDNPVYTFRPSDDATTGLFTRTIVKTGTCNNCHENLALHGGARFETNYCQTCHNPRSADANSGNTVDFKVMIHKIHRGEDLPSVIGGTDYCIYGFNDNPHCYGGIMFPQEGGVVFPQDIRNCENCHSENDPDTPDAANWYQVPTVEACGSCHDDVNFETGDNHRGGAKGNDSCTSCHSPDKTGGLGAYQKHRILTDEDAAKYSLNILTIDFMGPGTAPRVTFSVTDPTNNDMPYDLENDPDLTNGTSNLTFYMAWETTDYDNDGNRNSGATSTNVYSSGVLQAMPAGMFTYFIDLGTIPMGAVGSGGIAFAGQVATSVGTLQPDNTHAFFGITDDPMDPAPRRTKVDIDNCNNCHNRLITGRHNNRTNDINVCVMCHNPGAAKSSGGPMDMKQFIHRIHTVDGTRYPQRTSNCVACHTDDGFYPLALDSGVLASSVDRGTVDTDPTDNSRITPNAATCSVCHSDADATLHMEQNGASFNACQEADETTRVRVDFCGPGGNKTGAIVQESCTVCHDPGRTADVAVMHSLNLE
jgi:OmcA/MtrC family decaheme c-type cytochrome